MDDANTEYTDDLVISNGELQAIDDEEKADEVVEEYEQAQLDVVLEIEVAEAAETEADDI